MAAKDPVSRFFAERTSYSKRNDDLLNIHVGNPLRKITDLLYDIKKQKAFSFTLKGSLGVAGVFLTLSVFGVLGGGHMLCYKGVQSKLGTVKTLQVQDKDSKDIPVLSLILDYFAPKSTHPRVVLTLSDSEGVEIFSR